MDRSQMIVWGGDNTISIGSTQAGDTQYNRGQCNSYSTHQVQQLIRSRPWTHPISQGSVSGDQWSRRTQSASDRNTRVILFIKNLQLGAGETASSVVVNLIDMNNQSYDVPAEDVRLIPIQTFTQVIFRLPNSLPVGSCAIKVKRMASSAAPARLE